MGTKCLKDRRGTSRLVFETKKRAPSRARAAVPVVPEGPSWAG